MGRQFSITAAIHNELTLWCHLIELLAQIPTHLQEIRTNKPTWIRARDSSLEVMGGVYRSPTGQWHIWRLVLYISTNRHLLTDNNPGGGLTINDLELAGTQRTFTFLHQRRPPLNTYAPQSITWPRRYGHGEGVSVRQPPQDPYSEKKSFTWKMHIHAPVDRINGLDNKEEDSSSSLTHLPIHKFLQHLRSTFTHSFPWRLCPLPFAARRRLHTMLHTRLSPKASPLPISTSTERRGVNGTASYNGFKSQSTSTSSKTPCHSLKYSLTRYERDSLQSRIMTIKNKVWINTSAQQSKYSRMWGSQTPNLTEWDPSTFVWSNNLQPTIEKIFCPPQSSTCQSTSSTPSTPSHKAAPTASKPSPTSPGSHYSSSFFQ